MNTKKQGLFQRLFGKSQPKVGQNDAPAAEEKTCDYGVLPELARILTNGNEQAASDMRLLAENVSAFVGAHRAWCDEMEWGDFGEKDSERQGETLLLFAYWLTGYPATNDPSIDPPSFGAYIDWKEETDNIIELLGAADENLGYGLDLSQIKFDYTEPTDKALRMIDDFLTAKGLALCYLDTQSDCYHLFTLRDEDYSRLRQLAERVDFKFDRAFA
jgi:hypothetical protein